MFNIQLLKNPFSQKSEFLNTNTVSDQKIGLELKRNLAEIKKNRYKINTDIKFWIHFVKVFPMTLTKIILLRIFGTGSLLIAILASAQILNEKNTLTAGFLFIVLFFIFQMLEYIAGAYARRYQEEAGVCISSYFLSLINRKLVTFDHSRSKDFTSGNLKILITSDTDRVTEFLVSALWNGVPSIICVVILGPAIIYKMGLAGLAALISSFLTIPMLMWLGKYTNSQEIIIKKKEDILATLIGEWVSNVRLIRHLGWQKSFRNKTSGYLRNYTIESIKQHVIFIICYGTCFVWWMVPIILMLTISYFFQLSYEITAVFSVIWMLNHIQGFIKFIPNTFLQYSASSACIDRLYRFLKQPEISDNFIKEIPDDKIKDQKPVKVHFKNVGFTYENKKIIKNLSFTFDLSSSTSIIGTVGSGKSTVLKLMCGFIKPDEGQIIIEFENGFKADLWYQNIHKLFRSFIGYVSQEPYLSNATLQENISLTDSGDEKKIMRDLYFAGLSSDIKSFEKGINQEIGENGINLSGGQKHRVNLARCFYAERSFYLLDDPLSAVDADTEKILMDHIFKKSKQFILVSHRLTEISRCDTLIVMNHGEIIETGNPATLKKNHTSEFYKQLKRMSEETE